MSNIDKQALRERYSAKPTPKCDICGAKMTIQRMSGSRVTYGCSGAIYDETGCHYAEGRSLADDHYGQSRVTVTDESDPDVLALLDELEGTYSRIGELEVIATDYGMKFQRAQDALKQQSLLHKSQLEAAEKLIAELEASHGKLREAMAGIHNTISGGGAYTPLAAILNASKRAYEESAAAADKGE